MRTAEASLTNQTISTKPYQPKRRCFNLNIVSPASIGALTRLEGDILLWIQQSLRGPLDAPVCFITTLGNHGMLWIALTLMLLFFRRTRRAALVSALSMLLTLLAVNILIKPLAARIRPYEVIEGLRCIVARESEFSFPSGHSANSLACAWVLFRLCDRRLGVPALVMALLISLSRLYVGVHYPTDVLAGIAAGMLLAEAAIYLAKRIEPRLRR